MWNLPDMNSLTVYSDKYKSVTDQIFFFTFFVSYDLFTSADTKEVRKSLFDCMCVPVQLTCLQNCGKIHCCRLCFSSELVASS